jgi:hypothetical protein
MKHVSFGLLLCIGALIILAACGEKECKKDIDCMQEHFVGSCIDRMCEYEPIPDVCGNLECDVGENECLCPDDCGSCSGPVPGSTDLIKGCDDADECTSMLRDKQKPITRTDEVNSQGDRFRIISTYNDPFNVNHDQIELKIGLSSLSEYVKDRVIKRIEISGITPDRRTITIVQKDVNRPLWASGSEYDVLELVKVNVPGTELSGLLKTPTIKITYDMTNTRTGEVRSAVMTLRLAQVNINWVRPTGIVECESCDDNNPGTNDVCDETTNYYCEHQPQDRGCGNFLCQGTENQCSCPTDCGPCTGGDQYTSRSCVNNKCTTTLKNIQQTPINVFESRTLGQIAMNLNYKHPKPFNTATDKFEVDFELTSLADTITNVKVNTIRILDGQQELAVAQPNLALSIGQTKTASITVPALSQGEEAHSTTIGIWYTYKEDGTDKSHNFNKGMGQVTYITPGQ